MRTSATDDYDRSFGEVTDYNGNVVGIFYFLWLSQASVTTNVDSYIEDGNVEAVLTGDEVGMAPAFTYWGEPMYGFYQVEDEWVVRKHVELFINAGLDFICFDCTNNDFYQAAAKAVLDVLLEYAEMGYDVPRAMFMTNSDSTLMTENIYNAFYRRDTYDAVWFYGNGDKPWIISSYAGSDANILDRFYFKPAQWPNRSYNENGFPWISWHYPQETYTDRENDYTIMSVSVSQHTGIGGSLSDAGVSGINFSISGLFAPYNYDTPFRQSESAGFFRNGNQVLQLQLGKRLFARNRLERLRFRSRERQFRRAVGQRVAKRGRQPRIRDGLERMDRAKTEQGSAFGEFLRLFCGHVQYGVFPRYRNDERRLSG